MNSFATKLVTLLVSLFLLTYVGFQVFDRLYNPFESEIVKQSEYVQDIDLNGYFIRTEKVIDQQREGVIRYKYKNAEKFSKGSTIATIYSQENDLQNLNKVEQLQEQKDILVQAKVASEGSDGMNLNTLNNQISQAQARMIQQIDDSDLSDIDKTYNELMLAMNEVAISINSNMNFEQTINQLSSEIETLQSQISKNIKTITTKESGYFSNEIDGYEQILTMDSLKDIKISDIEKQISNQKVKKSDKIGKVISDFSWKFVSTIDANDAQYFKKGQEIKLNFSSASANEIDAIVENVIVEKGQKKAAVIFSGEYIDEDFITMRFEKPKAIISSYSGILIPKEAIHFETRTVEVEDEETKIKTQVKKQVKGVYTLLGKTVRFKQVDVIYEDSFAVISKPNSSSNYVSVYDKVITKGKDLHETA